MVLGHETIVRDEILVDPLSRQALLNLREYPLSAFCCIGFAMDQASEQVLQAEIRGNWTSQTRWALRNILSAH